MVRNEYFPVFSEPVGFVIDEKIEELGLTRKEVASRTGLNVKTISQLLNGHIRLTAPVAVQLENVVDMPARLMLQMQADYDIAAERAKRRGELADEVEWVKQCPYRELADRGFVHRAKEPINQLMELLRFYGSASPAACEQQWVQHTAKLRTSQKANLRVAHLAAWLRVGELASQQIECMPYNESTLKRALQSARSHSLDQDPIAALKTMQDEFAEAGVALVFVKQFSLTRCSGASRWLSPQKALIQLSFRYKTDDQVWFTLFHEASHLLKHSKKNTYLEDAKDDACSAGTALEQEADELASRLLISPSDYEQLVAAAPYQRANLLSESTRIGVSPGIIVGRLQHDGVLDWNTSLNKEKKSLSWDDQEASLLGYVAQST